MMRPGRALLSAARAVVPSVRLAYIDNDPIVTSHVRALLVTDDGAAAVGANLTDPASVLARTDLSRLAAHWREGAAPGLTAAARGAALLCFLRSVSLLAGARLCPRPG
jgi:hypothetical protein